MKKIRIIKIVPRVRFWLELTAAIIGGLLFTAMYLLLVAIFIIAETGPPPSPDENSTWFEKKLENEWATSSKRIKLSDWMSDEEIGFNWDEVCRADAYNYPDPIYDKREWELVFRKDSVKPHEFYRGFLINPIKFGTNARKLEGEQYWCIARSNAVLINTPNGIQLKDVRELNNTGGQYLRPWWKEKWEKDLEKRMEQIRLERTANTH